MLWPQVMIDRLYAKIKDDSVYKGCSVVIFVAIDCDSAASCHILTNLLRQDNISYVVVPIGCENEILSSYESLVKGLSDISSVLFLNCGAKLNLSKIFYKSDSASPTCYVFDNYRPVHLSNINSNDSVVVIDDGTLSSSEIPDDDLDSCPGSSSSEEGEEFDESGSEVSIEPDTNVDLLEDDAAAESEVIDETKETEPEDAKEVVESSNEEVSNTEIVPEAQSEEIDDAASLSSSLQSESKKHKLEQTTGKTKRRRLRAYYCSGCYYGCPISVILHDLSKQLNRPHSGSGSLSDYNLWLAIIGTTDAYWRRKLDEENYKALIQTLATDIILTQPSTVTSTSDARSDIFTSKEFKFHLHRHWNLMDSLTHSPFVLTKLKLLSSGKSSNGIKNNKICELFARLGVSIEQSKQNWSSLAPHVKRQIEGDFATIGAGYGLTDLFYDSFVRKVGYSYSFSAMDTILSINALMGSSTSGPKAAFNLGYDALAIGQSLSIQRGIGLAISNMQIVTTQALAMIQFNAFTRLRNFRYAVLENYSKSSSGQELSSFSNPQLLLQLGHLLIDIHRENKKWSGNQSRPLILISELESTAIVVGLMMTDSIGRVVRHSFATYFALAARDAGSMRELDSLDSSVAIIERQLMKPFLESLHFAMSA